MVTLVLASVAVNSRAPHTFPGELFRQAVRAALGAGEYQERTLFLSQHLSRRPSLRSCSTLLSQSIPQKNVRNIGLQWTADEVSELAAYLPPDSH